MEKSTLKNRKIISYLTFTLGDEHYALNVGKIINILEMQHITKVPKSPEYMPGIINLRGEVLPVIDTNIKLGLGKTKYTGNTCILVIESEMEGHKIRFGVLTDTVQQVLEFEDEMILPPPSLGEKYTGDFVIGVVEFEGDFIMVIDINKILESDEILQLNETAEQSEQTI